MRILVVDDNEVARTSLCFTLTSTGYEVETACDGQEALWKLAQNDFNVVLADLLMPAMDGYEFARRVRAQPHLKHLPIIFQSAAYREEEIRPLAAACGVSCILRKPADPARLVEEIRTAIELASSADSTRPYTGDFDRQHLALVTDKLVQRDQELELTRSEKLRLGELYKLAHQYVEDASHEFRTPLTVIKEFASMLLDGTAGDLNPEQREYVEIIVGRAGDLAGIINDMLDVSRLENGLLGVRRRECALSGIVSYIESLLRHKADTAGVTLDLDVAENLPSIYGDSEKIGRIIINLVINAIKFSGSDGRVCLSARWLSETGVVVVAVSDTGPGIPGERLAEIFERFRQIGSLMSSTKGFGLGLSIARELVHLNLGRMHVESQKNEGSTFSFFLPIADPQVIVRRYLDYLRSFSEGVHIVSLLVTTIESADRSSAAERCEQMLHDQLHRHDLLLRVADDTWLIAAAGDEDLGSRLAASIVHACGKAETASGPLPHVCVSTAGAWRIHEQSEEFIHAFETAAAPMCAG